MEPDQVVRRRVDLAPLKLNVGDVGYYRVQYEDALFAKLLAAAAQLAEADRLNFLNDTWALVQANRVPAAAYLDLASALAGDESFSVIAQIVDALWFIDDLSIGRSERAGFQAWARGLLQPQLNKLGWNAKPGESALDDLRRNAVIRLLGGFGDAAVQREARARFAKFLEKPETLTGSLRDNVWWIVGRSGDERTYAQLHEFAKKTDSIEQKRSLYNALAAARSPGLIQQTLAISLTDELPPQQAARLVHLVAEDSEQPELAWEFAKQHIDALFAKLSSIRANDYVPGIFDKFSDAPRAAELESWSAKNLPPDAAPMTAKAADAIRFKASIKDGILREIDAWCRAHPRP
jgi:aminopeptidase N